MLIRFSCSIQNVRLIKKSVILEAVCEMVRAHRRGHHLVVINRELSEYILSMPELSANAFSTISKIKQDFTQNGRLHLKSKSYVEIVPVDGEHMVKRGHIVDISLLTLLRSNICDKPKMLIENSSRDGWIYNFLLSNVKDKFECRHVEVDLIHGGGDDISAVFDQLISDRKIVCTLVDSDKNSPHSKKNSKLSKLTRKMNSSFWYLAFAFSPPCREIENLIPFELIAELDSGKSNPSNSIILKIQDAETADERNSKESFVLYFDYKEGINEESLNKKPPDDAEWIKCKLSSAVIDPKQIELKGYGESIVDQVKRSDRHTARLRELVRRTDWLDVFGEFFERLIWIFYSIRPTVT